MNDKKPKPVFLDVIEFSTGEVVHTVKTTRGKQDKVEAGLLRNMDLERFTVREREVSE